MTKGVLQPGPRQDPDADHGIANPHAEEGAPRVGGGLMYTHAHARTQTRSHTCVHKGRDMVCALDFISILGVFNARTLSRITAQASPHKHVRTCG